MDYMTKLRSRNDTLDTNATTSEQSMKKFLIVIIICLFFN